jgi:hypothetical protein
MTSVATNTENFVESPETSFWQQCRKRAEELGIPAWRLAEEGFQHAEVDRRSPSS